MLLVSLLMLPLAAIAGDRVAGEARVEDAATVVVGGQRLRLYGIATPVPGDMCPLRGTRIDCGHVAATALMDLVAGARVVCETLDETADPPRARCLSEGYDLSEGMVYTGWARPLPDAPPALHAAESQAREGRHGLWRGAFPPAVDAAAGGPARD
ncbi:MAG: thermonuclease family protein [Rhodothalassiaceae bacterium]